MPKHNRETQQMLKLINALEILVYNNHGSAFPGSVYVPVNFHRDHTRFVNILNKRSQEVAERISKPAIVFGNPERDYEAENKIVTLSEMKLYKMPVKIPEPALDYLQELREEVEKNGVKGELAEQFIRWDEINKDAATIMSLLLKDVQHCFVEETQKGQSITIIMASQNRCHVQAVADAIKTLCSTAEPAISPPEMEVRHGSIILTSADIQDSLRQMSDILTTSKGCEQFKMKLSKSHPNAATAIVAAFAKEPGVGPRR